MVIEYISSKTINSKDTFIYAFITQQNTIDWVPASHLRCIYIGL